MIKELWLKVGDTQKYLEEEQRVMHGRTPQNLGDAPAQKCAG